MPTRTLPELGTAAAWAGFAADGITPSPAIAFTLDTTLETPSGDTRSVDIAFAGTATGALARCSLAATDLRTFDELRLVLQSSRAAPTPAGSTAANLPPFYLELRLGSVAMPTSDPGNLWLRRIPIDVAAQWQLVRLGLSDLAPAVRAAVTVVEIRCLDASPPFELHIDEAMAVQPGMLADVEQALQQRLDGRVTIGGTPVPAAVSVAGADLPATRPSIAIVPLDVRCALERTAGNGQRTDFTANGYSVRAAPQAYELDYAIEALADNRSDQATVLDFLLAELASQGQLRVAGMPLTMEAVAPSAPLQILLGVATPRQRLYFRVWAWQEQAAPQLVRPAKALVIPVDFQEVAHA